MRYILDALRSDSQYKALLAASGRAGLPCLVTELCDTLPPVLTAALMDDSPECCAHLVLVPDEKSAASVKKALDCFLPECGARIYPVRDFLFNHMDSASREWEHERLSVLGALSSGTCGAVIATPDAALQLTMPVGRLGELTSRLTVGDEYAPDALCSLLSSAGYVRAEAVEGTGQFTRRGGIVDVFCPLYANALRIEFFGDEVDSIAYFDTVTQRRADNIMDCLIIPCAEVLGDKAGVERARKAAGTLASKCEDSKAKERLREEQEKLSEGLEFAGIDKYIGHIFGERSCLIDHFKSCYADRRVYVIESARGRERLGSVLDLMGETVKSLLEQGLIDGKGAVYSKSASELDSYLHSMPCVTMDSFSSGKGTDAVGGIFPIRSKSASFTPASLDVLRDDALSLSQSGYNVVISAHGKSGAVYIAEKLGEENSFPCLVKTPEEMEGYDLSVKAVIITWGADCGGFELPGARFAFLRESGAPSTVKKRIMKGKDKDTQRILSYADLVPGDYVVHTNYGIGVFEGIERLTASGIQKDYIKIKYAGSDALYVPCNQLDMVAKYIGAGAESGNLKLSKMGGEVWHKQKARVKAAAKEMAKKLIALYAERQRREGITYPPDGPWQKDFEATFEYDETSDQLRSAEEIREDMQRSVPMDRLLCGDVGFGKTEVALRAAFRAVSDSKQVAILVPTTILAWQHYQTILSRFRGFPVKAELLSRFRSPAQQQETLRKLKKGPVDIVVGTHRLIQDDVKFKNLGLLVVDEEQRFGVAHKERLKEMSKDIDVLTLTATPIPRTLNMALAGIRDMSVLEEAPHDRSPVQTYVFEYDEGLITEAIRRELRRAGQVFYMHNRVETISSCAARLSRLFPEAQVGIAHGQMDEESLSDVWRSLLEGKIDILVCTTIIETGVDVSNANTLIIEDADRLGLSQLHQIRGRVGRSSRKAYAYFTYPKTKILSEIASKRLSAIREFTEFGSGFRIAMRDLEIRGAGNILGAEQHGHMDAVGYDLYIRLLSAAVEEEKGGGESSVRTDCLVDVPVDAYIPEDYISSSRQRMEMYKRIASIEDEEDRRDVEDELTDRFGDIPTPAFNLIKIALLRNTACGAGIKSIEQKNGSVVIIPERMDIRAWSACISRHSGKLLLSMGVMPYVAIRLSGGDKLLDLLGQVLADYSLVVRE